jgi:hypothetical protein
MAGAGAVAAVAGLAVVGPITAVAAGTAAVYATTRKDNIGDIARTTGKYTASAASAAKAFNDEHDVTGKLYECGKTAAAKLKEANQKYGITGRLFSAAKTGAAKAKEINEKHDITGKVGRGAATGLTKATELMGGGAPGGDDGEKLKADALPSAPR